MINNLCYREGNVMELDTYLYLCVTTLNYCENKTKKNSNAQPKWSPSFKYYVVLRFELATLDIAFC